jgi:undecaprenyl-diphosphatase
LKASERCALIAVALIAFAAMVAIGRAVGTGPDPAWVMRYERLWVDHSTLFAWGLTWFGFAYLLVPLCVALVVAAVVCARWRLRVAFAVVSLLIAWQGASYAQGLFVRPRRLDWVVKHETAFSFPSSHAAIVAGFYWLWALLLSRSSLPHKASISAFIWMLGVGILWSRLALGAHYLTDLVGGVLWGIAVVSALAAVAPINVFERPRTASLE